MAKVITDQGFRLFFYSNEGTPREPVHIHVQRGHALAKVWLEPHIGLADSVGFAEHEQRKILHIVETHESRIREVWHAFFD